MNQEGERMETQVKDGGVLAQSSSAEQGEKEQALEIRERWNP